MNKELTTFGNIEIKKRKFHHCKDLVLLQDLDIDNIAMSSIVSSDEKNYKYYYWLQR